MEGPYGLEFIVVRYSLGRGLLDVEGTFNHNQTLSYNFDTSSI